MNKIKYLIILLCLTCSGCSDWLDVSTRQEMKQDELFKNEEGYKSALIGVYIEMAKENLYGKNLSFYFNELLTQTWNTKAAANQPADFYLKAWDFEHKDVEPIIEKIWERHYNCIASLNNILDNIDGIKNKFSHGNYELIKGEALGLRAFLHLDILRLFGPIPDPDAIGKKGIPYINVFTKNPNDLISVNYEKVLEEILIDLNAAEELLENDPILFSSNEELNDPSKEWDTKPQDSWQMKRQVRFNYYAVKGTKARYYHWIGEKELAVKYAKEVIESEKFRLARENDFTGDRDYPRNLVMLCEHLFGVHSSNHQTVIDPYFIQLDPRLTQTDKEIQIAYENDAVGDIRNRKDRYWQEKIMTGGYSRHYQKYIKPNTDINKIPLIRLVELYFIIIENSPVNSADLINYFSAYVESRGLDDNLKTSLISEDAIKSRMEKEHIKEFMGEGQLLYFYKRHGYEKFTWPGKGFEIPKEYANYEIPRPKSQINFD